MRRIKLAVLVITALLSVACSQIEDIPHDYFSTEMSDFYAVIPPETSVSSDTINNTISQESLTTSETTAWTSSISEEITTQTMATAQSEVSTDTTPAQSEATQTKAVTTVFIPGTLPPETEPTFQTVPSATIVTLPSLPESSQAEQTTQTSASQASMSYLAQNDYYTLNFDRQKAMWISYLEYDRIMKNKTEAEFTQALEICFDNIAKFGCNTVYFQTRVYGDAYYSSSLFPKGDRLTGGYDPLKIAVKAAHDKGLSIHAWINPMRLMTDSQMQTVSTDYKIGEWYNDASKNGTYIVNSSGRYYLNPAYSETVSLICDGISEIVTSYDVDGIQIDDYFYPTTDASFDKAAFSAQSSGLSLSEWRRSTVTNMVRQMYSTVHKANPNAVFGISPQGSMANNFDSLYADIYTWCSSNDCCDYICPQIYFGFENASLPYAQTVDDWSKIVTSPSVSLVVGLAAYKPGTSDNYAGSGKNEWIINSDILARQRDLTDIYNIGYAFFRYDSMFVPSPDVAAAVNAEVENLRK